MDCDEERQRRRLMARDGLSETEARARLAAQWPMARKRPLADLLIDNRGQPSELARATAAAWRRPLGDGGGVGAPAGVMEPEG